MDFCLTWSLMLHKFFVTVSGNNVMPLFGPSGVSCVTNHSCANIWSVNSWIDTHPHSLHENF